MSIEELEERVEEKLKQAKSISQQKSGLTISPETVLHSLQSKTKNLNHVFFSGLPLEHSKQVLKIKLEVKERDSTINKLKKELKDYQRNVQELNNNIRENFVKYELGIKASMRLGSALTEMARLITNFAQSQKKFFFKKLTEKDDNDINEEMEDLENLNKIYAVKLASAKLEILLLRRS